MIKVADDGVPDAEGRESIHQQVTEGVTVFYHWGIVSLSVCYLLLLTDIDSVEKFHWLSHVVAAVSIMLMFHGIYRVHNRGAVKGSRRLSGPGKVSAVLLVMIVASHFLSETGVIARHRDAETETTLVSAEQRLHGLFELNLNTAESILQGLAAAIDTASEVGQPSSDALFSLCRESGRSAGLDCPFWLAIIDREGLPVAWWQTREGIRSGLALRFPVEQVQTRHWIDVGPLFVNIVVMGDELSSGLRCGAVLLLDQTIDQRAPVFPRAILSTFRQSLPPSLLLTMSWSSAACDPGEMADDEERIETAKEGRLTAGNEEIARYRLVLSEDDTREAGPEMKCVRGLLLLLTLLLVAALLNEMRKAPDGREHHGRKAIIHLGIGFFSLAIGLIADGFLTMRGIGSFQRTFMSGHYSAWLYVVGSAFVTFALAEFLMVVRKRAELAVSQSVVFLTIRLPACLLPVVAAAGCVYVWRTLQSVLTIVLSSQHVDVAHITPSTLPLVLFFFIWVANGLIFGAACLVLWSISCFGRAEKRTGRSMAIVVTAISVFSFIFIVITMKIPIEDIVIGAMCMVLFIGITHRWRGLPTAWSLHWQTIGSILLIIAVFLLLVLPAMLKHQDELRHDQIARLARWRLVSHEHVMQTLRETMGHCRQSYENSPFPAEVAAVEAFRIWAGMPFVSEDRAMSVSVHDPANGAILGHFGFQAFHSPVPDFESLRESDTGEMTTLSSGRRTFHFIQQAIDVPAIIPGSQDPARVTILVSVELSSFPSRTARASRSDFCPAAWLDTAVNIIPGDIIQTEYLAGVARSSLEGLYPPLPDQPQLRATLNREGMVWLRDQSLGNRRYDVLYLQPSLLAGGPELVSYAFPVRTAREMAETLSRWFFICFLFSALVVSMRAGAGQFRFVHLMTSSEAGIGRILAYRVKVMAALLVLSLIPLISVLYLFLQSFEQQYRRQTREVAAQTAKRSVDYLLQRGIEISERVARRYVSSTQSESGSFLPRNALLFERWQVGSISIQDSQGFSIFEWKSENTGFFDLHDEEDVLRAQTFWRGSPSASFMSHGNSVELIATVPFFFPDRPSFPAGTVTITMPITTRTLQEIGEFIDQHISLYVDGRHVLSSDAMPAMVGLVRTRIDASTFKRVGREGAAPVFSIHRTGLMTRLETYVPLVDSRGAVTAVLMTTSSTPLQPITGENDRFFQDLLLFLLPVFFLVILTGIWLAHRFSWPMSLLLEGTRRISAGDLSHRIPAVTDQEFSVLIEAFNSMTGEIALDRQTLEQRRRTIETILNTVSTGILVFDQQDKLITLNSAAGDILCVGQDPRQCLGSDAEDFFAATTVRELADMLSERPFTTEKTVREVRVELRSRALILHVTISPFGVEKQVGGWIMAIEDLTDTIESNRRAALVDMARQVAHEVKNPLTPIQLSTEHIMQTWRDGATEFPSILQRCVNTILTQVGNLRRITSEFSSFARLPQPVRIMHNLNDIIRELIAGQIDQRIRHENIIFNPAPLPDIPLDRGMIEQVLLNILTNAGHAIDARGTVWIETGTGPFSPPAPFESEEPAGSGDTAWIAVRDDGEGVDATLRSRIFEPYFSTRESGSGLGLAISKKIMRDHAGDILLYSQKGLGSIFLLILPIDAGNGLTDVAPRRLNPDVPPHSPPHSPEQ